VLHRPEFLPAPNPVDVLLSDLNMPEMTSTRALPRLPHHSLTTAYSEFVFESYARVRRGRLPVEPVSSVIAYGGCCFHRRCARVRPLLARFLPVAPVALAALLLYMAPSRTACCWPISAGFEAYGNYVRCNYHWPPPSPPSSTWLAASR
jgi:hypothetical protein